MSYKEIEIKFKKDWTNSWRAIMDGVQYSVTHTPTGMLLKQVQEFSGGFNATGTVMDAFNGEDSNPFFELQSDLKAEKKLSKSFKEIIVGAIMKDND